MVSGLNWFPLPIVFDDNFRLICAEYDSAGFEVVIRLWQKILQQGYYLEWSEEVGLLFASDFRKSGNLVSEIVKCALRRGVFDEKLYKQYGILTSKQVQDWYFAGTERRKNKELVKNYLLVDVIKNTADVDKNGKNVNRFAKNADNPEQRGKERKGEEKREPPRAYARRDAYASTLSSDGILTADETAAVTAELTKAGIQVDTPLRKSVADYMLLVSKFKASKWLQLNKPRLSLLQGAWVKVMADSYKDFTAVLPLSGQTLQTHHFTPEQLQAQVDDINTVQL